MSRWFLACFQVLSAVPTFASAAVHVETELHADSDSSCALQTAQRIPVSEHRGIADLRANSTRRGAGPKLFGVNAGGWLILEDWFFSGKGGTQVSSADNTGQGACLPPLLKGPLEKPWMSEGGLTKYLQENPSVAGVPVEEVFTAHREAFITSTDLKHMADVGIKMLRVPITWAAFADALKDLDPKVYGQHNPDVDPVVVPDPYYTDEISYVTVPRSMLKSFILEAHGKGIGVLLDIHAMPGGSSKGTYNGVWPLQPVFWDEVSKLGSPPQPLTDLGTLIFQKMLQWISDEGLAGAVKGVTPMNEPALNMNTNKGKIFDWLGSALDTFHNDGNFADSGVSVYMNFIGMRAGEIGSFLKNLPANQKASVVVDIHYYMAWSTGSQGCCGTSPRANCGYDCTDAAAAVSRVGSSNCAGSIPGQYPEWPRKAATEFSMGTFNDIAESCQTETDVLDSMLSSQSKVFDDNEIEAFFWTWRMPYGPNFESQWSLKRHLGLETLPFDEKMCQTPKGSNVLWAGRR